MLMPGAQAINVNMSVRHCMFFQGVTGPGKGSMTRDSGGCKDFREFGLYTVYPTPEGMLNRPDGTTCGESSVTLSPVLAMANCPR